MSLAIGPVVIQDENNIINSSDRGGINKDIITVLNACNDNTDLVEYSINLLNISSNDNKIKDIITELIKMTINNEEGLIINRWNSLSVDEVILIRYYFLEFMKIIIQNKYTEFDYSLLLIFIKKSNPIIIERIGK